MGQIKPDIDASHVRDLCALYFDAPVVRIEPVAAGEVARTFFFAVDEQRYVIRFNQDSLAAGFAKEAYVYANYASPQIPIPEVVEVGGFLDYHFTITCRAPGVGFNTLSVSQQEALIPALIQILDAIHGAVVADDSGFGTFGGDGVGKWHSWRGYLAAVREEEEPWDFYGRWHHMFHDTFLEQEVFDLLYDRMIHLLDYCPEERYLVHGDYGYDNLIVDQERITAVIDWGNAKYGDPLYDVAWLDIWPPQRDYADRFRAHYQESGIAMPNYEERVRCYQCYIGLDAMRFAAKSGQHGLYVWVRDRVLNLTRHYAAPK